MTFDDSTYHRAVAAEVDRKSREGITDSHYDAMGLDDLLRLAFRYASEGRTVKTGAVIVAARAYLQRHKKNPFQSDIEKFMIACDQEVKKYPEIPSEEVKQLRIKLMVEELLGTTNRSPDDLDIPYVFGKSDELIQSMLNDDLVGVADGLADVIYVVVGTAAAYGIDIQEVFDEVQRSNMTKAVWDEASKTYIVEKNEFGKVIKPESYSPADLDTVVSRQIENGKIMEAWANDQANDSEITIGTIDV